MSETKKILLYIVLCVLAVAAGGSIGYFLFASWVTTWVWCFLIITMVVIFLLAGFLDSFLEKNFGETRLLFNAFFSAFYIGFFCTPLTHEWQLNFEHEEAYYVHKETREVWKNHHTNGWQWNFVPESYVPVRTAPSKVNMKFYENPKNSNILRDMNEISVTVLYQWHKEDKFRGDLSLTAEDYDKVFISLVEGYFSENYKEEHPPEKVKAAACKVYLARGNENCPFEIIWTQVRMKHSNEALSRLYD